MQECLDVKGEFLISANKLIDFVHCDDNMELPFD